jgi:hypothetical protein
MSRGAQWWFNKIPPLLAVGYGLILARGAGRAAVATLLLSVLTLCVGAVFANVVNDATDIDEDARRGKRNAMAGMPPGVRLAVAFVLFAATGTTALLIGARGPALGFLGALGALAVLYSVAPIRLKERGVPGVVADTVIVHVGPVAWIGMMLLPYGRSTGPATVAFIGALLWSAGLGARGILGHRVAVAALEPGLTTFGSTTAVERIRRIILRVCLPLEWLGMAAFIVALAPSAPLLVPAALLILTLEWLRHRAGCVIPDLDDAGRAASGYLPLAAKDAYEVWVPVALVAQLAARDSLLIIVAVAHLVAFLPALRSAARQAVALPAQARAGTLALTSDRPPPGGE